MKDNHLILFKNVFKEFDGVEVLTNINMYIRENEFLTLLGPSGCGKTTMLRLLAGFEAPTSGDILFEGVSMVSTPPYKRKLNTVFQRYALFPHMNVFDNIAFGLTIKKVDKPTIRKKVGAMLDLVGLSGYQNRSIDKLSGGQMQRVAFGRPRLEIPQGDADRTEADAAAAGHHVRICHPRSGGGAHHGRYDCRHRQRHDSANR